MYFAANSRGSYDLVPRYKDSIYSTAPFFVVFIMIGSFFIMNLFVGVIISAFNRESERLGKNFLLTEKQKKWAEAKILVLQVSPRLYHMQPSNKFRKPFYTLAMHGAFELSIMVVIVLNTIVMGVKWEGMDPSVVNTTEAINFVFTGVFVAEASIKLIAFGRRYFMDTWNVFDMAIVVISVLCIILQKTLDWGTFSTATT